MTQRHPLQNDAVMFITTVTKDRIPFFTNESYAREAVECLYRVQGLYPFFLFGFVIMPDHCHLLMRVPPPASISKVVKSFKAGVAHGIGKGIIWQPRFYVKVPDNSWKVLSYIHQNPVTSNLVEHPEHYRWSSAYGTWDVTSLE